MPGCTDPAEVLGFFHAIGIPVRRALGPLRDLQRDHDQPAEKIKIGTVGPPVPRVEMRVAEDGELLCRSPFVMKEYRNKAREDGRDDRRRLALTGDIGEIDEGLRDDPRPQEGS